MGTRYAWLVILGALVGAVASGGCSPASVETPTTTKSPEPSPPKRSPTLGAARIYQAAEAQLAAGHHANAVALLENAIRALPPGDAGDPLRHKLVMRTAHVELVSGRATGNSVFARRAAAMLIWYADQHVERFGNEPAGDAVTQRDQIFELLYHAEEEVAHNATTTVAEAAEMARADPSPRTVLASRTTDEAEPPDDHAGEDLEARMQREVHVEKPSRLASLDDPRVRQRLEDPSTNPLLYAYLTKAGTHKRHDPRPAVRLAGPIEAEGRPGRAVGVRLFKAARPNLRACYGEAFARSAEAVAEATVELTVDPDGTVRDARVVDGLVVDGAGDACVMDVMHQGVATAAPSTASTLRLPLMFFWQNATYGGDRVMPAFDPPDADTTGAVWYPDVDDFSSPTDAEFPGPNLRQVQEISKGKQPQERYRQGPSIRRRTPGPR